jgi:GTP 3',8-cyclase
MDSPDHWQLQLPAIEFAMLHHSRHTSTSELDIAAAPSAGASLTAALVDRWGRIHRELRISITDVCNIRCQYCMPEVVQFLQREKHLSIQQIAHFVQSVVPLGLHRIRITGGEPLVRPDLPALLRALREISGVEELSLTTNGTLLEDQVEELVAAGLQRINISLDTLSEARFQQISRRPGIDKVLRGIDAAIGQPQLRVKLNALVLRDINLEELLPLVDFARQRNITIRFIEFMPLDGDRAWSQSRMVSGEELRQLLQMHFGQLLPVERSDASQPASEFRFAAGGTVGFIDSVTQPFCNRCDRLRLTSDGKIRNCLFGREEWDVAELLRKSAAADQVQHVVRSCVAAKHPSHGIDAADFQPPQRAMYQIGG